MTKQVKEPQAGDVVLIGFTANGGRIQRVAKPVKSDVINCIYEGTDRTATGLPIYPVRLNSGDMVNIVSYNKGWKAIN